MPPTAGSLATSLAIALGNTLEAVVGGWFVERRQCGGTRAFDSSGKMAKFALISIGPPHADQRDNRRLVAVARRVHRGRALFLGLDDLNAKVSAEKPRMTNVSCRG